MPLAPLGTRAPMHLPTLQDPATRLHAEPLPRLCSILPASDYMEVDTLHALACDAFEARLLAMTGAQARGALS